MKKSSGIGLLIICLGLLLINCKSNMNIQNLSREWKLISFEKYGKEDLIKKNASINMLKKNTSETKFAAYMGCNRLLFNAKFDENGTVSFSEIGATMKYCEGEMELEKKFISQLPDMTNYSLEGHYLILRNKNGAEMKFIAADWD